MSWSTRFRAWCASPHRSPAYLVEVVSIGDSPGSGWIAASHPSLHGGTGRIVRGSVSVTGQSVQPGVTWATAPGAFAVDVIEDVAVLFDRVTRGTLITLCTGDATWAARDLERVAIGVVRSVTWSGSAWRIQCWDLWSAMSARLTLTALAQQLFYNAGVATTLAADYTVGDTTVTVSGDPGWEREDGGYYCLKIDPNDGTNEPFYLRSTSFVANVFTIDTPGADRMGTTRAGALTGCTVYAVPYLLGHPIDIAYKAFAGGSGSGSSFDVWPTSWGFGVPDEYLDLDDRVMWQSYVVKVGSGSYSLEFTVDDPQDNALGWLTGWLAGFGLFPAMRQGSLTIRAAQTIGGPGYIADDLAITDADMVRSDAWEYWAWDESTDREVHKVSVYDSAGGSSSSDNNMLTFPGTYEQQVQLTGVYANVSAIRTEVLSRLASVLLHVPERVRVVLLGLRHAALAPGDLVPFTSARVRGRLGRDGYVRRLAFVAQVSPAWDAGLTAVDLLIYPTDDTVFGGA